jgi:hypothetical protein
MPSVGRINTDEYLLDEVSYGNGISQEAEASLVQCGSQGQGGVEGCAAGQSSQGAAEDECLIEPGAAACGYNMVREAEEEPEEIQRDAGEEHEAATWTSAEVEAAGAAQEVDAAAEDPWGAAEGVVAGGLARPVSASGLSTALTQSMAANGAGRGVEAVDVMQMSQHDHSVNTEYHGLPSAAAVEAELLMSDEDMVESLGFLEVRSGENQETLGVGNRSPCTKCISLLLYDERYAAIPDASK